MARTWTSGSEVKRAAIAGGVMLYDASRVGNLRADWFDPVFWRKRNAVTGEAAGRGATLFFAENGHEYALRHYRRGGLIARVIADRYLWRGEGATRPFAEWHLTYHLAHAGLPVAPPVAARFVRHGLLYRGDLITERLHGTKSLAATLELGSVPILTWVEIGRNLRRFHDLGVCHADLNAHNILLGAEGAVHVIDFDRATLRRPGLWRDANLVRLRRSLDKVTDVLPPGRATEADWHSLLAGYREGPPAAAPPAATGSAPDAEARA
ncbi:MAG: 3-deoxy-D-manno-octulosonic acid kinase [Steroidobacteraceae bacterium]|nr:3-deoxy-D-manno-octulosonic acid kinase [Steroidobacteraceae bacterium]